MAQKCEISNETCKTWLILVNGGDTCSNTLKISQKELYSVYNVFLSNQIIKRENVILMNARDELLFDQNDTIRNITPEILINILEGVTYNNVKIRSTDNVVIFFAGHGESPENWHIIPPSGTDDENLGSLIFLRNDQSEKNYMTYKKFSQIKIISKTLIIFSLACYSGNMFKRALEVMDNTCFQKCVAICLANEDHPASFDYLLGPACETFFKKYKLESSTALRHLCCHLQMSMREHEYNLKMKSENLLQNEKEYEDERLDAKNWAVGELKSALPTKIPRPMWAIFREVEQMKETIKQFKKYAEIPQSENISTLNNHIENLDWYRFDLMRMYKHKPNNDIQYCGNIILLDELSINTLFNI